MSAHYNILVRTEYGLMVVNRNDWQEVDGKRFGVGYELMQAGRYQPGEMALIRRVVAALPPNPVALDIGANIGVNTLVMSEALGAAGCLHAFEPQRVIFQMLMGNLALNSIENVYGYNLALGTAPGELELPPLDYARNWSFGGLGLGQPSPKPQFGPGDATDGLPIRRVEVRTLDSFGFDRVDFIKLDVEEMELDVLRGAAQTIERTRPVMLVEWLRRDRGRLPRYLFEIGYEMHLAGINLLCVPVETTRAIPLEGTEPLKVED